MAKEGKLRAWRIRRALTQEELSERSRVPLRSMLRIERGELKRPPNLQHLVNLAHALAIPVTELLEEEWLEWRGPAKPPAPEGKWDPPRDVSPRTEARSSKSARTAHEAATGAASPASARAARPSADDSALAPPEVQVARALLAFMRSDSFRDEAEVRDVKELVGHRASQLGLSVRPHPLVVEWPDDVRLGWAVFRTASKGEQPVGFITAGRQGYRLLLPDELQLDA